MLRLLPKFVTLMGGISLGLALTYFVAVVAALLPAGEAWAEFFVPRALWLLVPPYILLIAYLFARNHLGRYLLHRQAYELARQYSQHRLKASVLRSRREVANHRLVTAQALLAQGDYDEAQALLEGQQRRLPGSYAMEARRWQIEIALRRDEREKAQALVLDEPSKASKSRGELVATIACAAELAIRQGDKEGFEEHMANALWQDAGHWRVTLCRALAMMEYDEDGSQADEALQLLEKVAGPTISGIPARASELCALRALVHSRCGRHDEARKWLAKAADEPADKWSQSVIADVKEKLSVTA